MSQDTQATVQAPEKVKVSVNAIKTALINGDTRADIAKSFGMSKAELNRMMKHPKLQGIRPKKASGFILVDEDDTELEYPKPVTKKKEVSDEAEAPTAPAEETVTETTGI